MLSHFINIHFEKSDDVSEELENQAKESFLKAAGILEKEWNIKSSIEIGVLILSDSAFREGATSGPQSWKYCFLLRDHSENLKDYNKNKVYIDVDIFNVLSDDANRMIKHEVAHLVVANLIKDLGTYRRSFLLEEGTAGLDGATETLISKIKKENIKEIPNPLLIKNIDDAKSIGGDTNIEPFTEQLGDLIMMSFVEFLRKKNGEQKILEVWNNLSDQVSLEESYKQICGEDLNNVVEKWKISIIK